MFHRCPVKRLTQSNVPSNRTFVASNVRVQEITHGGGDLDSPYLRCPSRRGITSRFSLATPRNVAEYITVFMPSYPHTSRGFVQSRIHIKGYVFVIVGNANLHFPMINDTLYDICTSAFYEACIQKFNTVTTYTPNKWR